MSVRGGIIGILFTACAGAAACGIDARGTAPADEVQSLPDAGSVFEAAAPDASGCRSITTTTPGSLVAPKAAPAPTVDGDLSDWDTCFLPLNRQTAYATRDLAGVGGFVSGEFSIAHDGDKLFVAARVAGLAPLGDHPTDLYRNDSIEIYVDADGVTDQSYGADTLQVVVDHAGRLQGYRMTTPSPAPSARAAANVAADGVSITIEIEIVPQTLGAAAFGTPLGFDVALNNGSGTDQLTQVIWFQKCRQSSGCGCADGNDAPYCDARQLGTVMLEP